MQSEATAQPKLAQEAYRPDLEQFCDILKDYAVHGLRYFDDQGAALKASIRHRLANHIEETEHQITSKFSKIKKGKLQDFKFLPMAKPGGDDFIAAFFRPEFTALAKDDYTCKFKILFWITDEKTMALRLEQDDSSHSYTHWQFTKDIGNITTSLPAWIPNSYPAIPLGYDRPIQLFVGVLAAVHGYSASENDKDKFAQAAIRDSMATGNAAQRAKRVLWEFARTLSPAKQ